MHRPWLLALLLAGAACGSGDEPVETLRYASPLDGQTGWPVDQPLTVYAESMSIPPDYPLEPLLRVVETTTGGFVEGRVTRTGDTLTFTPRSDWLAEGRYTWAVDIPEPVPHGPELTFPETVEGEFAFSTGPRLDVLAGGIDADGRACVILSRPSQPDDAVPWSVTIGTERTDGVVLSLLDRTDWSSDLTFPAGDPGVDVLCLDGVEEPDGPAFDDLTPGTIVRFERGEAGPWRVELEDATPTQLVRGLRGEF